MIIIKLIYRFGLFQRQENLQISLSVIRFTGILKRSQTTEHLLKCPLFLVSCSQHNFAYYTTTRLEMHQNTVRKQNLMESQKKLRFTQNAIKQGY